MFARENISGGDAVKSAYGILPPMADHFSSPTFRLFRQRDTFYTCLGTVLDRSRLQSLYNTDTSEEEADLKAIASDWQAIGQDLENAIKQYAAERE